MNIEKCICFLLISIFSLSSNAACVGLGCSCSASASPINFGVYQPLSGNPLTGNGGISVTCSALLIGLNVSYVISLSTGASGTYSTRTMKLAANNLNYNIYTNSAFTTIWGNGTAGTATISDSYSLSLFSVTRTYTAYGLVPGSQNAHVGTYNDTITVTVTY